MVPKEENKSFLTYVIPHDREGLLTVNASCFCLRVSVSTYLKFKIHCCMSINESMEFNHTQPNTTLNDNRLSQSYVGPHFPDSLRLYVDLEISRDLLREKKR